MSDRYIIFVQADEPFYVEDNNGWPLQLTFDEAKKRAEDEATEYPGTEIHIYGHVATSIAPVGKVEIKEFKS